jgi:hypothetical protein
VGCSECDGTASVTCNYDHQHKCPDCIEGKVKVLAINTWLDAEQKAVSTPAGYYDRRYLWLLQKFEITQAFKCHLDESKKVKALLVCGDGFRAKVLCIRKF